jgi:hypothetical protein
MRAFTIIVACTLACAATSVRAQVGSMSGSGAVSNVRPGVPSGLGADQQPGFGAPIGPGSLTSTPPIQPRDARPASATQGASGASEALPAGGSAPAATPLLGGSSWGSPAPAPSPKN